MVECLRDLGLLTLKTEGVRDQLVQAMMSAPRATGSGGMPAPGTESLGAAGQETQDAIVLYRQGKVVEAEAAFDKNADSEQRFAVICEKDTSWFRTTARTGRPTEIPPSGLMPFVSRCTRRSLPRSG